MAITNIATTDYIVAESHPSLTDIKNRAGKELHAKMLVEHNSNGVHNDFETLCVIETGSFLNDATATRTISLTETTLTPKFVISAEEPASLTSTDADVMTQRIVNGGFDSDTSSWTATGGTIASVAGGQSGNCCEMTEDTGIEVSQDFTTVPGRLYRVIYYVKAGTAGTGGTIQATCAPKGRYGGSFAITVGADWATFPSGVPYFFATADTTTITFTLSPTVAGTTLLDSVTVTEQAAQAEYCTDTMTAGNYISALTEGAFTITHSTEAAQRYTGTGGSGDQTVNQNSVDAAEKLDKTIYAVFGTVERTYSASGSGTDPDWVEDGQQMLGGTEGTEPGNRVEQHIYTQFDVEHTDAGVHDPNPWAGTDYMRMETGRFTANALGNTVVTLEHANLQIKDIWVIEGGQWLPNNVYYANDAMTMPNCKRDMEAAFLTTKLISIGTGTFTHAGNGAVCDYVVFGVYA